MATARAHKKEEMSPAKKEITEIRHELHTLFEKMNKDEGFCPKVQDLDKHAKVILKYINKHHKACDKTKSSLKDAIIELTEIPLMHHEMQRIAIRTALKMACENIDKFCLKTF